MLRPNQGRARTARLVFLLLAFSAGGLVLLSAVGLGLPDWDSALTDLASPLTLGVYYAHILLGLLYLGLLIGSYVVLIMWLRRAYYNLHQLPGIHPEYSDGWAAGAWFVPFLNFVRPFTIMREVWQDTQRAAWGRIAQPATIVGWWWTAFIVKTIIGRVTAKMGNDRPGITQDDLVSVIFDAGAELLVASLTWYVIGRVAAFEADLVLRQQVDQLGQSAPSPAAALAVEQSDYGQPEGY